MRNRFLVWHLVFWVLIFALTLGVAGGLMPLPKAILFTGVNTFFYTMVFYTNTLVLFPKYYETTRSSKYFVMVLLLLIATTAVMAIIESKMLHATIGLPLHVANPKLMMTARIFLWLLLMVVVGTVFLIQRRLKQELLVHKEMQANKLQTELKLLRSQINPHFLFNALNNIFSLSYMKSDKAPESILKLSGMLRYVIEDCTAEKVSVQSEIEYIKNYIDFQRMKSPEDFDITFDYEQLNSNLQIPPMLFINFIENSFKYSKIEEFQNANIHIALYSDEKGKLTFTISNTVPATAKARPGTGTGINNVKQRLNIIYPGKHHLIIDESKERHTVTLAIETKSTT